MSETRPYPAGNRCEVHRPRFPAGYKGGGLFR